MMSYPVKTAEHRFADRSITGQDSSAQTNAEFHIGGNSIPKEPFILGDAKTVELSLQAKGIGDRSTVLTIAILPTASERSAPQMNKAYFDRLNDYCLIMMQADKMLSCGAISEEDYAIIDTKAADRLGLSSCSIYRGNPLMYRGHRGNMSHDLEVNICPEQ